MKKAMAGQTSLNVAITLFAVVMLQLLLPSISYSADCSSTKTGNWNDPTVWSTGTVPVAGDNVTILSPHIVSMNGSETLGNLTVNSGGTLQFNNTTTSFVLSFAGGSVITVNGNLDMGVLGVLQSGSSGTTTLTMGSGTLKTSNLTGDPIGALGPGAGASLQTQGTGVWDLASVEANGYIQYIGSASQAYTITDRNYNNLTLSGAGLYTWTLAADRTIKGTLLAQNPNKLTLVGTQTIFLGLNLNTQFPANGFDAGTSTFVMNGTAQQFINHNGPALNNFIINKPSGAVITYYASTFNGYFTVTAGSFTPSHAFTIKGTFTNNASSTGLSGWNFGGDFINNGTFSAGAAGLIFNGTAPQTIGGTSATTFGSVTMNNAAGVTLASNATVTGTLTLQNGVFTLTGGLTLGNAAAINRFTVASLSGTPTFGTALNLIYSYNSAAPSVEPGPEMPATAGILNNLSVYSATTLNLNRNVDLYGTLYLQPTGAVLNAGVYNIEMKGKWQNDASTTAFNGGSGTVTWVGNSATAAIAGSQQTIFNNVVINMAAATNSVTQSQHTTVAGAFTLTQGKLSTGIYTLTAKGDFINNAAADALTAGTGTVAMAGAVPQTIGGAFGNTFYKFTMNNAAGVTLNANQTVNNILTLTSGNINTGASVLTSGASGTVVRTSGHVEGNFRKNFNTGSNLTKNFEIGTGVVYSPVSLTFPSVTTAGGITAMTVGSEHPDVINSGLDASLDVNRYWTVTNNGLGFTTCNATYNFVATDVDAAADWNKFEVRKLDGTTWLGVHDNGSSDRYQHPGHRLDDIQRFCRGSSYSGNAGAAGACQSGKWRYQSLHHSYSDLEFDLRRRHLRFRGGQRCGFHQHRANPEWIDCYVLLVRHAAQ